MDYSTVLSNASKLKKNNLYKVTIADNTREILYHLNTAILSSHDAGQTKVSYKLPVNFKQVDDTISNKELQTAIYYNIITELEKKGYDVKLQFFKDYTLIMISWVVKASMTELESMQEKIMSLQFK
jgi:hypothetical protein